MTTPPTPRNGSPIGFGRICGALLLLALAGFARPTPVASQSLNGSRASVDRQARAAQDHDFSFLTTGKRVQAFVDQGLLVRVHPGTHVELHGVSYPYARPEVALFVERLASQYHSACGERLVVTSLTRPTSHQPRNASERSVHPTGMALDVRYSRSASCRKWLEGVLLGLEKGGTIEATRERFPPHYHIAVFPQQYKSYVDGLDRGGTTRVASAAPAPAAAAPSTTDQARASRTAAPTAAEVAAYKVRRGDSLWTIARAYGTTVDDLRSRNNLRNSRIFAGQVIEVPRAR